MPEWMFHLGQLLIAANKTQLAAIVVTLAAVAFAVYSIVVLGKIARCTEDGYARLVELLADLRDTGEVFDANCSRMASAVECIEATRKNIEAGLKQPVGRLAEPVSGLSSFSRVELGRLLAQNSSLEADLSEARSKLSASDKLIAELRQQKLAGDEAEAVLARLHAQNRRLLITLRDTRRRLWEAEQKSEPVAHVPLRAEAGSASAAQLQTDGSAAENLTLRGRIKVLEIEGNRMRAKIDEREEELARTLREKSLIEERFMQREMSDQ